MRQNQPDSSVAPATGATRVVAPLVTAASDDRDKSTSRPGDGDQSHKRLSPVLAVTHALTEEINMADGAASRAGLPSRLQPRHRGEDLRAGLPLPRPPHRFPLPDPLPASPSVTNGPTCLWLHLRSGGTGIAGATRRATGEHLASQRSQAVAASGRAVGSNPVSAPNFDHRVHTRPPVP